MILSPGWMLCVDESFCAWVGRKNHHPDGLPHSTIQKGKPVDEGLMFKCVCCAMCGVMLMIEIQEGKKWSAAVEWAREYGMATACTLRLTEPWHNTGRLVVGDSWFAGVTTVIALSNAGLYFTGVVKTMYSKFPLGWLRQCAFPKGSV